MLNKRSEKEYRDYIGMIFSTLPKSVKDLNDIETFMISNITSASGSKEYIKVYGRMKGDTFTPDPIIVCDKECAIFATQSCDEIIDMIINGQLSVEQKFEHRHFNTIQLTKDEIRKTLGKIVPFYI